MAPTRSARTGRRWALGVTWALSLALVVAAAVHLVPGEAADPLPGAPDAERVAERALAARRAGDDPWAHHLARTALDLDPAQVDARALHRATCLQAPGECPLRSAVEEATDLPPQPDLEHPADEAAWRVACARRALAVGEPEVARQHIGRARLAIQRAGGDVDAALLREAEVLDRIMDEMPPG